MSLLQFIILIGFVLKPLLMNKFTKNVKLKMSERNVLLQQQRQINEILNKH